MKDVEDIQSRARYSARRMSKPINFHCDAPDAKAVEIVGDFNDWQPGVHRMHRQPDGTWFLQVSLHHGHHRYRFLVDGQVMLDSKASGVGRDEQGARCSLRAVS
ncbi:MAG: isoamylase early set domain-containing protein [Verrucomicrobiales bacterium]|nr:isoamylase early set domain-containing protein [Verrucomicrobiales bacterium]